MPKDIYQQQAHEGKSHLIEVNAGLYVRKFVTESEGKIYRPSVVSSLLYLSEYCILFMQDLEKKSGYHKSSLRKMLRIFC